MNRNNKQFCSGFIELFIGYHDVICNIDMKYFVKNRYEGTILLNQVNRMSPTRVSEKYSSGFETGIANI